VRLADGALPAAARGALLRGLHAHKLLLFRGQLRPEQPSAVLPLRRHS
jgi:hypothetical protein